MDLPELGAFLRSRRDRITPDEVGIVPGPRRRVPGLRRDEVAMLAGASVEYYIELEQGSRTQPSPQMLAALTRALRLTKDERDHVYRLAGRPLPSREGDTHVDPAMLALLDRLDDTPALIISDLAETLAANDLAKALLCRHEGASWPRSSQVYCWFSDPDHRARHPEQDYVRLSESLVADLRLAAARRAPDDPRLAELIALCTEASAEFATLWEERTVRLRRVDSKVFLHPHVGSLDLLCHNLYTDDGSQHLLWFTARADADADKLALLKVVGEQEMSSR
ncbi:helix-turn-helix transcriptional regulator [Demequina sp. NBRC 110054]|uniref:helix-turn-helix transcriptional regulator n=1 Tax=Demequina sp. NBRC 110054 TaxID=1570343 RepID=UPI0009FCE964|nr:helix-turn-helix transcriptional regulator [Demequina sp. NBRC 110054]